MSLVDSILDRDGRLFPPVDENRLIQLTAQAQRQLGLALPDDYLDFLRRSNGACVDGVILYPAASIRQDAMELPGIIEINLSRRQARPGLSDLVILGEFDDDYLVYQPVEPLFQRVDRIALDRWDAAPTLGRLVTQLLDSLG